ncbi:hypothetical protein QOZ88_05995 [Blastococcus sp. BMG 814]|uniref:Tape measure protein n=1 Tax=Blastococcus carthaginiensis TaxID=3050034 RepID=A0ABT9I9D6_9ACTN|nr:hypothetical protein [Blastococcus carthaginiensis]MDP5182182.1 hypothetical protein [Blastococcus carthaginiensis]
MSTVGYATLQVIPSMQGIGSKLTGALKGPLAKAGVDGGTAAADGLEKSIGGRMKGIAGAAAGAFIAAWGAAKVGEFITGSITAATDLSESTSKIGVVFGGASQQVLDFAANASSAFGQSRGQALEAAGTFGNLLRSLGLTEQASAEMSTSMVGLASDLASFNNTDPAEALDALRAGLTGETEPLKKFGVNLNDATLKAKALELGLSDGKATLDASAKAQAAYALVMEQTSLAQGDFARTSAGLANQQRILGAQWTDVSANIGGLFVPALGNAANLLTGRLMPGILSATSGLPALGDALGSVGDVARVAFTDGLDAAFAMIEGTQGAARWVGVLAANVGDLSAVFREAFVDGAGASALLGASGLEGFAVTAGEAAFRIQGAFYSVWEGIRTALGPVVAQLQTTFSGAFTAISESIGAAFGSGGGSSFLLTFADALSGLAETALPLIIDWFTRWAEVVQAAIPMIVTVIQGLVPVVQGIFAQLGPVLQSLVPVISQVAGVMASTLLTVLNALAPVLPVLVQAIGQVATMLAGAFMGVLEQLLPILPPIVEAIAQIAAVIAQALAGALRAILPVIPSLVTVLVTLVTTAITPLLPLLPLLAGLFAQIITALAPLLPPLVQIIALIIQLAIAAISPLLPFLPTLIGLFTLIVQAITPIIGVVVQVIGVFIRLVAEVLPPILGFVSRMVGIFTTLWTSISTIVGNIFGSVTGTFGGLVNAIVGVFSGVGTAVGTALGTVGSVVRGIVNGIISAINNTVIAGINLVIDGANFVNPFDDVPHVPRIPRLAEGGIVPATPGGVLAFIGEGGEDELVIPRSKARSILGGAGDQGGRPIELHVHTRQEIDVPALARQVARELAWGTS